MGRLPGDVLGVVFLDKLKSGLENVWGETVLMISSYHLTPQNTHRAGFSSVRDGFYFQCFASCPRVLLAFLKTQAVEGEFNIGIEMYPADQRRESAHVRCRGVFSLVSVSVTPINSSEKCTYSSEGENIPLCLFLFNIVYTENGETYL